VEGNQDESIEKSSKFLVNISGYYMGDLDPKKTLEELRIAINDRLDRGDQFRELLGKRVSILKQDIRTPIPDDDEYVEGVKKGILDLAALLDSSKLDSIAEGRYGGRRNFRRYSRRKRR